MMTMIAEKVVKINNFLALIALLSFLVLLRVENSSFSNEISHFAFKLAIIFLFVFGPIYLFNSFLVGRVAKGDFADNTKRRIKEINKKIVYIHLYSAPAYLAIAGGLYGLYSERKNSSSSFLDYELMWYGVIATGAIIEVIIFTRLVPLFKERSNLFRTEKQREN